MIHMKSLIRRLDCVPWLLAACCLIWAGPAQAQLAVNDDTDSKKDGKQFHKILLELSESEISEDALEGDSAPSAVEITVTATRLKADGGKKDDRHSEEGRGRYATYSFKILCRSR